MISRNRISILYFQVFLYINFKYKNTKTQKHKKVSLLHLPKNASKTVLSFLLIHNVNDPQESYYVQEPFPYSCLCRPHRGCRRWSCLIWCMPSRLCCCSWNCYVYVRRSLLCWLCISLCCLPVSLRRCCIRSDALTTSQRKRQ